MRNWGWRFISKIGALALLGFFLLLISLPNLIDLENFRPQLLEYLQSRISGEVKVGKLKLTFSHGPGVRVDGIWLLDKSGSQQISVATAIVNFDLKRLFKRRLHLCRVTLVQPRVVLQVDAARSSPIAGFLRPVVITNPEMKAEAAKDLPDQFTDPQIGEGTKKESVSFLKAWRFDADVSQALVEIIDGSVVFTDCCFVTSPVITHLEDLNLLLKWQKSEVPAEFRLTARVADGQGDGSLKIEGSLSALQWPLRPDQMFLDCQVDAENLNAATYFPYYQKYVPMRFIGARVDIDSTYKGNLMGLFRSHGRIVLHQAELDYQQVFGQKLKFNQFSVNYDFRLADRYNTIETQNCTIEADGFKISGYCLLHEARRGIDGTIEAQLEIPEFDPLAVSHLLPWKIMPEKMRSYYQSLQKGGRCIVENAYLKGDYRRIVRLADKNPPMGIVGGRLKGENLTFKLFDSGPVLVIGAGSATLESDLLKVSDLDFAWSGLSGEAVSVSLQELYHDPQIKFAGHLDLDFACLQSSLERFFQGSSELPLNDPLPVTFLGGSLFGDLALQGPLLRFSEITWGGIFKGCDLAFEFAGQPLAITQGEGSFVLANDRFTIENATCNFASLPLALQGSLPGPAAWCDDDDGKELPLELSVRCREFSPEHLDLLLGEKFSVNGVRAGPSPLNLHLTGDLKHFSDLKFQGTLSLDWSEVKLPFMDRSFESLDCLADFGRESIDFKRLLLKRGDSDLSFKGSLAKEEEGVNYVLNGEIAGTRLLVDDFLPLTKTISSKETPEFPAVKVKLEGVFKELVLPVSSGTETSPARRAPWHYLNDFKFSFSGGPEAVVKIKECGWRWGEQRSQISVLGQLQFLEGLHGELEIEVQDLNLNALFNQPERKVEDENEEIQAAVQKDGKVKAVLLNELAKAVKPDRVEVLLSWKEILARNNLHISARAQHLRWQQMTLDEIECDCALDAMGIKIKKLIGRSFGGGLYASAQWRYADDYFTVESQLEEIDFETFNDYLKNPDRGFPMRGGHGSVSFDLDWQGRSLNSWEESLDGQLDFNFRDGRLKKFTLVANICSLLNLSQFAALRLPEISIDKGVPYQTLLGQGTIINGVLEVEEFALRGSAFNLLSRGLISLVDDRVDLEIGVQPLQMVDKLLATIPVVGYIITGDQKTFVVIPMTARGPFDDIKIKTQTVSGLGKKAGGMIQRFFKTPIRLLKMPGKLLNQVGAEGGPETDAGIDEK